MREKELRFVLTFYTTADAMAMEKLCRTLNIEGKLISAPRMVSADCGIAWSSPVREKEALEKAAADAGAEIQGFHELML